MEEYQLDFICRCAESNRGPIDYESSALPTELQRLSILLYLLVVSLQY